MLTINLTFSIKIHFTNLKGANDSNGDVLIGDWQETSSGVLLTCTKKLNSNNAFLCLAFLNDQQIGKEDVVWQGGNYIFGGSGRGTLTNEVSTYSLTFSDGSTFKKWGI